MITTTTIIIITQRNAKFYNECLIDEGIQFTNVDLWVDQSSQ